MSMRRRPRPPRRHEPRRVRPRQELKTNDPRRRDRPRDRAFRQRSLQAGPRPARRDAHGKPEPGAGAGPAERERLRSLGRIGGAVAELLEFFAATYECIYGFDAPPLHDAVAVAAVLEPTLLETRPMRVEVECEGELTRGETVCDFYGVTGKPPNAEVGVRLDREGFFDLLLRSLERL